MFAPIQISQHWTILNIVSVSMQFIVALSKWDVVNCLLKAILMPTRVHLLIEAYMMIDKISLVYLIHLFLIYKSWVYLLCYFYHNLHGNVRGKDLYQISQPIPSNFPNRPLTPTSMPLIKYPDTSTVCTFASFVRSIDIIIVSDSPQQCTRNSSSYEMVSNSALR